MKLKLTLLAVVAFLLAAAWLVYYAQRPISQLPPTIFRTVGIDARPEATDQYEAFLVCEDRRPVVVYLLRQPANSPYQNSHDVYLLLKDEIDLRMTHLARWQDEVALFVGESPGDVQPIPISIDEFQEEFGSVLETNTKAPFDLLDAIWSKYVDPHIGTATPENQVSPGR
ncbi:hypothetical protein LOC68_22010 [Blastopirellula sp. JC732]|uniref:Uncharacterized protein n=1 Tax=Blastopirellula sediminis TaxID=2894196 RepID=A0A9X1SIR0_9BACT|nr:hypothetical protein [Blastopirellula sediminis]MCC9605624.1 hypothetical protein [Blastopirellula sediminis]MCC9631076.1 hypothetical protein [Blastopirellula sediminis]